MCLVESVFSQTLYIKWYKICFILGNILLSISQLVWLRSGRLSEMLVTQQNPQAAQMGRKMRKWKIVCEGEHLRAVVFGVGELGGWGESDLLWWLLYCSCCAGWGGGGCHILLPGPTVSERSLCTVMVAVVVTLLVRLDWTGCEAR